MALNWQNFVICHFRAKRKKMGGENPLATWFDRIERKYGASAMIYCYNLWITNIYTKIFRNQRPQNNWWTVQISIIDTVNEYPADHIAKLAEPCWILLINLLFFSVLLLKCDSHWHGGRAQSLARFFRQNNCILICGFLHTSIAQTFSMNRVLAWINGSDSILFGSRGVLN